MPWLRGSKFPAHDLGFLRVILSLFHCKTTTRPFNLTSLGLNELSGQPDWPPRAATCWHGACCKTLVVMSARAADAEYTHPPPPTVHYKSSATPATAAAIAGTIAARENAESSSGASTGGSGSRVTCSRSTPAGTSTVSITWMLD